MMRISRATYPSIFKAFDDIVADNMSGKANDWFDTKCSVDPLCIEQFIASISDEERELMTMGDQDEAEAMFSKHRTYHVANKLLNEFFDSL